MPDHRGKTARHEALALLQQAEDDLRTARALVDKARPTRAAKSEAFRLLSGVSSVCEVLKIAIDPW